MTLLGNKSLKILDQTNDGDKLAFEHLQLVEAAINGQLNDKGIKKFDDLYYSVIENRYVHPWLHDVENIISDQKGYIYWKGIYIEHFDSPNDLKNADTTRELADRCNHVEQLGIKVCQKSILWHWKSIKELKLGDKWLDFLSFLPCLLLGSNSLQVLKDGVEVIFCDDKSKFDSFEVFQNSKQGVNATEFNAIENRSLDEIVSYLEQYYVPSDFFQSVIDKHNS